MHHILDVENQPENGITRYTSNLLRHFRVYTIYMADIRAIKYLESVPNLKTSHRLVSASSQFRLVSTVSQRPSSFGGRAPSMYGRCFMWRVSPIPSNGAKRHHHTLFWIITLSNYHHEYHSTLLEPQSRFGDRPLKFQVVCPQNGTAVLKGLKRYAQSTRTHVSLHLPE